MKARILSIAEVGEILQLGYPEVRDMVARREVYALVVVGGDALIAESSLRELIEHSLVDKPWEGLR